MADLRIEVASHAGVCYGVERALKLAAHAAESARGSVTTLGPLIHNPIVVRDLESAGVKGAQTVDEVESGTLIIRAHGVVPQVIDQARAKGLEVLDATCPYVKKVHMAAEKLVREGYQLIVVGESGHPEVEGILGHAGDAAHVVSTPRDLDGVDLARKVGVVVQTTQTPANLTAIVSALALRTMDCLLYTSAYKQFKGAAAALGARMESENRMHPRVAGPDPEFLNLMPDYLAGITLRGLAVICADLDGKREMCIRDRPGVHRPGLHGVHGGTQGRRRPRRSRPVA